MEYQDELGLNLYDMPFRDYDPAIARWTGIDPVVHYSQSTYNAFDGNPVFWADPSGADSENDYSQDIFGRDKFGADGMFIPFSDRGEADFENSLGEDGTGHVATNNDDNQDDQEDPKKKVVDPQSPEEQKKYNQDIKNMSKMFDIEALEFFINLVTVTKVVGTPKTKFKSSEAVETSSKILNTTMKQLQAKFKHATDFGVKSNWNRASAAEFNSAINKHINSVGIKTIKGTYRGQPVIHSVNPNTGLNVISSPSGQFISGWKLNSAQLNNVLRHGGL